MTHAYIELLIALILGAIIGVERSFAHKTAGMRTYSLLSMGSCMLVIIGTIVAPSLINGYNPLYIAGSLITGLGFLCGGVIIFQDKHLSGLTTAAGLWVSAGVGIAVGYGLISLAVFATFITLIVLTIFWYIEHTITERFTGSHHDRQNSRIKED